jgi:hypothetical protein
MPVKSAKPKKLARLQRQLKDLVVRGKPAPGLIRKGGTLSPAKRMGIYAYAHSARLVESLADDFPGVAAILGENKFDRLAKRYFERHPSHYTSLLDTGRDFPLFMRKMPLYELARFEWEIMRAFYGPFAPPFEFAGLSEKTKLRLQPALGLAEFPRDVRALWLNPDGKTLRRLAKTRAKYRYAFFRVDGQVDPVAVNDDQWRVLQALRKGTTIATLAGLKLKVSPGEWMNWFQTWAAQGWLTT